MQIENAAFSFLEVTVDMAYDYDELFVPQVASPAVCLTLLPASAAVCLTLLVASAAVCCTVLPASATVCWTVLSLPGLDSLDKCVKWKGSWV